VLCAVGKHQAQFRQWRQAFSSGAEQDSPQLFSQRSTARLASGDQVNPALAQMRSKIFHLRGFAYAVKTLKGDEFAALWKRHDRDLIINQRDSEAALRQNNSRTCGGTDATWRRY
jgi:hypothetical protein